MNNAELSPFLRSQCAGGQFCSATCEIHRQKRKRSPKKQIEFSDEDIPGDEDDDQSHSEHEDDDDDYDYGEADDDNNQDITDDPHLDSDSLSAFSLRAKQYLRDRQDTSTPKSKVNKALFDKKQLTPNNRRNNLKGPHKTRTQLQQVPNNQQNSQLLDLKKHYLIIILVSILPSIVLYFNFQRKLQTELAKNETTPYCPYTDRLKTLEDRLESNRNRVRQLEDKMVTNSHETNVIYKATNSEDSKQCLGIEAVNQLISQALSKYDADKTDLADYALESSGATIITTRCTKNYPAKNIKYSYGYLPILFTSNSPRVVIQPTIVPGECWAFAGNEGQMVVQLSRTIIPTSFTYEHIRKQLSPDLSIGSAPKNFRVKSLKDASDHEGTVLGDYEFYDNGEPLQQFHVQNLNPIPTRFIELLILSNHGEMQYTCLYRFRVHGRKYDQ